MDQLIKLADQLDLQHYAQDDEHHFVSLTKTGAMQIIKAALSISFCHVSAEFYSSEDYDPARYLIKILYAIGE